MFVGSCNGFFRALDKNTGETRWAHDVRPHGGQPEFHGAPLISDNLVFAATDDRRQAGTGFVYAFERATGKLLWKRRAGRGVGAGLRRSGSSVWAVTLDDEILSLDAESGRVNWAFKSGYPNEELSLGWAPAVLPGRLIFAGRNGTVYALNANSGQIIWKLDLAARITAHPAVVGGDFYIATSGKRLYRINAESGEIKLDYAMEGVAGPTLLPIGDSLLALVGEDRRCCLSLALLNPMQKQIRWRQAAPTMWNTVQPLVVNDVVLVGSDRGEVFAYHLRDGAPAWSHRFRGDIRSLTRSGPVLYVGNARGVVYACKPAVFSANTGEDAPRRSKF